MRWGPGDHVVVRHVLHGRPLWAWPLVVVRDDPELIAFYLAEGTRSLNVPGPRSEVVKTIAGDFECVEKTWEHTNVLQLTPPDAAHAVYVFWSAATGDFLAWYINLQQPLQRTAIGFDTCDQALDVIVFPDLTWQWKDEDEFAEMQEYGLITADEAAAIRAEGERVIADLEARRPPFCDDWPSWRPDPAWGLPSVPDGWESL